MAYKKFVKRRRALRRPRKTYRGKKPSYPRRTRYYRRKGKSSMSSIKVKCNGQVQPYASYTQKAPYWKGKLERLYFNASKNCYRQLGGFSINGSNGSQGVSQQFIWSASDIIACLNTINALAPGASGQTKNINRVYLQSCDLTFIMTNSSNAPIEMDIYVFDTKNDAEDSLITTWEYGLQDMIGTGVPDTNSTQYGITPLNNPAVSQYYKCIRIYHYVVSPGQMFKYTHHNNCYRLWNNERLNADLQTDSYFRGLSQTLLFVTKGSPAQQNDNISLTSTAAHEINAVMTKEYRFKYVEDRNYNMNDVTDLTNTTVKVVNIGGADTNQFVNATYAS